MSSPVDNDESMADSDMSFDASYTSGFSGVSNIDESSLGVVSRDASESPALRSFKGSKMMYRSKLIVYSVLFLSAIGVGTVTFTQLHKQDTNDFESEFQMFANELLIYVENHIDKTVGALNNLANSVTSYLLRTNSTSPFFVLPHFARRSEEALRLSHAKVIALAVNVVGEQHDAWIDHIHSNQGWLRESLDYYGLSDVDPGVFAASIRPAEAPPKDVVPDPVINPQTQQVVLKPLWQMSPPPTNASVIAQDVLSLDWFRTISASNIHSRGPAFSGIEDFGFMTRYLPQNGLQPEGDDGANVPHSTLTVPVYDAFLETSGQVTERINFIGNLLSVISWEIYLQGVLPEGKEGYVVVINDGCGTVFTFVVNGKVATFRGYGDLHNSKYDDMVFRSDFGRFNTLEQLAKWGIANNVTAGPPGSCLYNMRVYPSRDLESSFESSDPYVYAALVLLVFIFTALIFFLYDVAVQRRQDKVVASAEKTTAIVSSLFPKNVQERILQEANEEEQPKKKNMGFLKAAKHGIKEFLDDGEAERSKHENDLFKTKPIADLFPAVTIMFADMVGFTAWSSTREPSQVFTLLETVYHAFDVIAHRRRVFKVETVGDCYVAVSGLPDPRKDHAVVMARFSRDCLYKMNNLTKKLEETLGPDTADLGLRIGLHSGPVTAGVLRGEKARFQLFGDSVNTTARMESTGERNRIHISQETSDLLVAAGKSSWIRRREDKVVAKGKGELQTYWLDVRGSTLGSTASGPDSDHDNTESLEAEGNRDEGDDDAEGSLMIEMVDKSREDVATKLVNAKTSDKINRLVTWNTEILANLLKQVVARREASGLEPDNIDKIRVLELAKKNSTTIVLDEVEDIIVLPKFDARAARNQRDPSTVKLDENAVNQLQQLVRSIAALYRENAFHNFEHVSHVTMSVVKLLGRIVAPELEHTNLPSEKTLHDHTYGITSDPLTQFAVVFSALIHDVDHTGVSNAQLVKEKAPVASAYRNQSVAEQNSVDIAWNLLMDEQFEDLRNLIYTTELEFRRFRQLVVNTVMATDVIDKDLNAARKARWNLAFAGGYNHDATSSDEDVNRKATIVIEHLIQASDVAHTMQHWHIYRKWNTRLFEEMLKAYRDGRAAKDPAEFWYEGELGFFDNYVITLAKKLKDCGVFGVSSDEYLTYATQNRKEWEQRGREVVSELTEGSKNARMFRRMSLELSSPNLLHGIDGF